jgi:hypothetical protein
VTMSTSSPTNMATVLTTASIAMIFVVNTRNPRSAAAEMMNRRDHPILEPIIKKNDKKLQPWLENRKSNKYTASFFGDRALRGAKKIWEGEAPSLLSEELDQILMGMATQLEKMTIDDALQLVSTLNEPEEGAHAQQEYIHFRFQQILDAAETIDKVPDTAQHVSTIMSRPERT